MTMLKSTQQDTLDLIPGSRVRVVLGSGSLERVGHLARELGGSRILLVTDAGVRAAGHVDCALESLADSRLSVQVFDRVVENPTTRTVKAGLAVAREFAPDLIVGLGGGSAMDSAKGINFLLTNGGKMADYWGTGKARRPMLPVIAIPTTAGTGSEAQSYALISDARTHVKMACGDPKALPRAAILDPQLTATQPPRVAAMTGIDAMAHAVETAACRKRTDISRVLSRRAWQNLESAFERAINDGADLAAREQMLLGAHLGGCAIENSMLGAAHAAANPLTATFGITHGSAVGVMLPHVIRFNCADGENPYADLAADGEALARRIEALLVAAALPWRLNQLGVPRLELPQLAAMASQQWTAQFNFREVGPRELLAIYQAAYE